jgi:succinyl-CoA synthetase beta subunit
MSFTRRRYATNLKLFEHEAKEIFSKYGIPTPRRGLADSPGPLT